jgi:lysophospholipid acyltransferase (LPLAT)-like uncharacterized protein
LPGAFVAKSGWRIRAQWTDMLIPLPFTTIYIVTGEPITIPAGLSRKELAGYVSLAQDAMDRLNDEAEKICAGKSERPTFVVDKAA